MAADGPSAIIHCIYCKTQLSYPPNSIYIQCPKCTNTMNPQAPNQNYMNCVGCGTLLSHPPTSLTIQCPKCLVIMELPVPVNVPAQGHMDEHWMNAARKTKKKRKDPQAPKRASNAYMIFCKEHRAQLKNDRPDLAFGKLGAKLGEMWRALPPEDKKPYELRAAQDRERYKEEMGHYDDGDGEEQPEKKRRVDEDGTGVDASELSAPAAAAAATQGALMQPPPAVAQPESKASTHPGPAEPSPAAAPQTPEQAEAEAEAQVAEVQGQLKPVPTPEQPQAMQQS